MNSARHGIGVVLVLSGAAVFAGCGLGDAGDPALPKATAPVPVQGTTDEKGDAGTPNSCIDVACQDFPLPPSPHAVRLTSAQWERTIRDLLKLPMLPGNSMDFPPDPVASADKFGSEAGDLIVTTQHWAAYQKAAESLADLIVTDNAALGALLPSGIAQDDTKDTSLRIAAFVADFLPQAYRRAVTAGEIADVISAGEQAAVSASGNAFVLRVKWILTSVLQSPKLIYRISFGDGEVKDKRARLSGYEVASKLSYGLWGTMPDAALTALAKNGKLGTKEGVAEVARAMLKDPRAEVALAGFHDDLYLVEHFTEVKNRPLDPFKTFYPEFTKDAQTDVRRSVQELIIKGDGGLKELHTSTVAFVNKRLAPVYGIDVPELAEAGPDVFAKVQMDGTIRKGILMHPGWLTYEATPKDPSPIRRGAYIARHVLCTPLGSPPPGAAGADPNKAPGATNRLRVEATTKGCGDGCHGGKTGVINPFGFSFENFDSIGHERSKDGDSPIDTNGSTEGTGAFAGAVALFDGVSTNARAHACYAAHWSSYLNGTSLVDITPRWLAPAVARSLNNGSVREIIVELVQTDAFLTVSR